MVTNQQSLLASCFILHGHKTLQSRQNFLHATSGGRVIKVTAKDHNLTLLGHLACMLEVWVPAADERLNIQVLVCFAKSLNVNLH